MMEKLTSTKTFVFFCSSQVMENGIITFIFTLYFTCIREISIKDNIQKQYLLTFSRMLIQMIFLLSISFRQLYPFHSRIMCLYFL